MKRFLPALICLAAMNAADLSGDQQRRIDRLESSLLAPCCWQEPVKTHRSDLSLQIKSEIAQFVAAGKSDREILDVYKARYGQRVLVEPEGAQWWIMNVVPVVMAALGVLAVVLVIRRMLRPIPASSP